MKHQLLLLLLLFPLASLAQFCTAPLIKNGRPIVRNRGMTLKFKCYKKFKMVDDAPLSICSDGDWVPGLRPKCIKAGCGELEEIPNGFTREKFRGAWKQFVCDPGHELQGNPVLICDSFVWNGTAPRCVIPYEPPRRACDFPLGGTCDWEQMNEEEGIVSWAVKTQPFGSDLPAFAFVDISPEAMLNSSSYARLFSPVFTPDMSGPDKCFNFKVHLKGFTSNELKVYQVPESTLKMYDSQMVLSIAGLHSLDWLSTGVRFRNTSLNFQLVVEATISRDYQPKISQDQLENGIAVTEFRLGSYEECQDAHSPPFIIEPAGSIEHMSPMSCFVRCGMNTSVVTLEHQWKDGSSVCECTKSCLLDYEDHPVCCSDYVDQCHYGAAVDSRLPFMRQLGISWLGLGAGCATTVALAGLTAWVTARRMRRKMPTFPRVEQGGLDDDSDLRFMMMDEEEDPEQRINFTLATPSTLDLNKPPIIDPEIEEEEEPRYAEIESEDDSTAAVVVTKPIIHARKVTMI